jgi:hypothetical protein
MKTQCWLNHAQLVAKAKAHFGFRIALDPPTATSGLASMRLQWRFARVESGDRSSSCVTPVLSALRGSMPPLRPCSKIEDPSDTSNVAGWERSR